MNHYKQFKLSNGEEIICEVISYPDEESADLVVKNSYRITLVTSGASGTHYYALRPWMIYQDDPERHQIININHIVGECDPTDVVLDYYFKNVNHDQTVEDAANKLREYLEQLANEEPKHEPIDSDNPNVLVFKPKNTRIH